MEEFLDVYTRDGKYLGVKNRSEFSKGNPGFYHKPAWTWVYNSKGEIQFYPLIFNEDIYAYTHLNVKYTFVFSFIICLFSLRRSV